MQPHHAERLFVQPKMGEEKVKYHILKDISQINHDLENEWSYLGSLSYSHPLLILYVLIYFMCSFGNC